ncbi:MAG TPA: histidine kinase dimerization/phospho-acceptor domain-containing protein [Kofleriaceae bacterium]|nr:histidine kinase dimerization/phospho-acceptor domain-containing protein [Kofleriaceae bacterium]
MAWAIAAARRLLAHVARIRYRLLLVNVIVAAVPIVGITFAHMHETQLLNRLEADMIHQGELVRAIVLDDKLASGDIGSALGRREHALAIAARDTRMRIRLLDERGVVVADSHRGGPPEGAERAVPYLLGGQSPTHSPEVPKPVELADRREVRAALAGRYGSATRLWDKQERVYLFSALPIIDESGHVAGVVYVTRSTHDIKLHLFELRSWLSHLLVAALAGTALLSLLLATTIARPLGKLTKRAQRIAARQPVEPRDRLTERADEIGQLARAVESMTDELERRARDARTLAADISHEFKTPLTGIRGAAELLRDGAADEAELAAHEQVGEQLTAVVAVRDQHARRDRQIERAARLA